MAAVDNVTIYHNSTLFAAFSISPPIDIPADDILELFGKTFFEFCQDSGYDKILQVLGATPRDFLQVSRQKAKYFISSTIFHGLNIFVMSEL